MQHISFTARKSWLLELEIPWRENKIFYLLQIRHFVCDEH